MLFQKEQVVFSQDKRSASPWLLILCCLMIGGLCAPAEKAYGQTYTVNSVYFQSGSHERRPTRSSASGFMQFGNPYSNPLAINKTMTIPQAWMPSPWPVNPTTQYVLAFVNVTGLPVPGGAQTFYPPFTVNNLPQFMVGSNSIVILLVYLPQCIGTNCGGIGQSGATIDAFDESTGNLVNDIFVTVTPDPPPPPGQPTLTDSGNNDGWVSTANTETIAAYQYITPTSAVFDKWVDLTGAQKPQPGAVKFTATQDSTYNILAFYKAPPTCTGGQVLNSNGQCAPPTCTAGTVWKPNYQQCCPPNCQYGCIWMLQPPGSTPPVLVCKPKLP